MKVRKCWRTVAVPLLLGSVFALGTSHPGTALAETDNWVKGANCNNWHPHSWSDYNWAVAPSNTSALSQASLAEWDQYTSSYQLIILHFSPLPPEVGSYGAADADAYEQAYSYGSGTWQAVVDYAEEYGTQNGPSETKYIYPNCG